LVASERAEYLILHHVTASAKGSRPMSDSDSPLGNLSSIEINASPSIAASADFDGVRDRLVAAVENEIHGIAQAAKGAKAQAGIHSELTLHIKSDPDPPHDKSTFSKTLPQ
jgi:hypothetical protein